MSISKEKGNLVQKRNAAMLALLAACAAVFLTALDQTVVVTALPRIITDLQIPVVQLDRAAWIVSGYLLGYVIAMADIPIFIATVLQRPPLDSGLALLRLTAMIPIGALTGGWLCSRITCRLTAIIGLLPTATGFWLMHLWPLNVNWAQITVSTLVGGLGFGLVIAPIGTTAINAASSRQIGMASSVVTVLRMVGMILGLAALTSWGLGRFRALAAAFKPPKGVSVFSAAYNTLYGQYLVVLAHQVYTDIFLVAGVLCVVEIIPALFLEGSRKSDQKEPIPIV